MGTALAVSSKNAGPGAARGTFPSPLAYLSVERAPTALPGALRSRAEIKENEMTDDLIGFTAVVLVCSIPLAAIYAYYRIRKLRSEERLAAIAKGVAVPLETELPPAARSRRAGILLVTGGLGYSLAFALISTVERDALIAAAFGIIPVAIGIGYFIDATLVRRDAHPAG